MYKKLTILAALILFPFVISAQLVFNTFDTLPDSNYFSIYGNEGIYHTYVRLSLETTIVQEGSGALRVDWQNECYDQWGGWIGMTHTKPDSGFYDLSPYTHLSLWYYVEQKQSKPGQVEFRVILNDGGPGTTGEETEAWISHHWILDDDPGWHQLKIKLEDVGYMSSEGFWLPGSDWGLFVGNGKLDLDKIVGYTFEFSQSEALYQQPDDTVSGVIILDDFEAQGVAPVNLVFFNGKAVPGNVNMHVGWSGSAVVTDEDDAANQGTGCIKWVGGDAWDGINFDLESPKNLLFNWSTDSVQFKIKAPAETGDLTLVFWDVDEDEAKNDYAFQATYLLKESDMSYDGTWKQVKVPLRAFDRFAGVWDNDLGQMVTGEFDSTKVAGFGIWSSGQDLNDKVIYLDDIYTGSPVFDFVPPAQVSGVSAAPGDYYNLVYWTDVEGESGETYNVYASENPITDVNDPVVEVIATGISEDVQNTVHYLTYPLNDHSVTFYYAVECVDASGNVGPAGVSDAVTNTAQGVPTIADHAPENFAADGDFSDWDNILPWLIMPSQNNIAAGDFENDDDLTATVWLAMDDDYFYVAADVLDNVFHYDANLVDTWWTQDAFELFIGLWDQNGKRIHDTTPESSRGVEPDYKLIFVQDRYYNEYKNTYLGRGSAPELTPDDPDYHFEEFGGMDWALEAKIPLDSIAFGDDLRFHPQRGMRIMFDLVFHDNDGSGWEGNLSWSPNNRDMAYLDQHEWTYTWIGDTNHTVTGLQNDSREVINTFSLQQNYPNPFNPVTTINYSIARTSKVELNIYNMLGQKIVSLVNTHQNPGHYTVQWNAASFPSGVYLYKLKAGDFEKVRKMLLVK
ncbi:MAG: T9SS type A sorting domain-containing protein [Caldisericaceae bacterium]|nr:T9SS type A sorting domain-containing protein [Caldisericaceae bacterium]